MSLQQAETNESSQIFGSSSNPWHTLLRVIRYLAHTSELSLRFGSTTSAGEPEGLCVYRDAAYAGEIDTTRSHSGYMFVLRGRPGRMSSKRQEIVATSSTKAEYIGQCTAIKKVYFLTETLNSLGFTPDGSMQIFAEN